MQLLTFLVGYLLLELMERYRILLITCLDGKYYVFKEIILLSKITYQACKDIFVSVLACLASHMLRNRMGKNSGIGMNHRHNNPISYTD